MTNQERIAHLEKIIQEAQSQKDELQNEGEEKDTIRKWEEDLGMTSESAKLADKGKGGSGF